MAQTWQCRRLSLRTSPRAVAFALAIALAVAVTAPAAHAQTYTVLHTFTGEADGGTPAAGLTMDAAGDLYGTAYFGGLTADNCYSSCGIVFRMARARQGWVLKPIYTFTGGDDGGNPDASVAFGPDGTLYGTTFSGGGVSCPSGFGLGCGIVFNLRPSPSACKSALCPWSETVLHRFAGGSQDGALSGGAVVFDQAGNLYGTAYEGGYYSTNCAWGDEWCGVIFKLTPSNGGWTESLPHIFAGGTDGANPDAGLVLDATGNLYGTTDTNGTGGAGAVFELSPSGYGWEENVLHPFGYDDGGGEHPVTSLIFDPAGNLYGSTESGGGGNGNGTVFELTPAYGGWTYTQIYAFQGSSEELGPRANLVMDNAGNLYGTAYSIGNWGLVFKLTPSDGGWIYTVLHQFAYGDGGNLPLGAVVLDANGNLYGTTSSGGAYGYGTVWEITP